MSAASVLLTTLLAKCAAGIVLDRALGEPRRWHPLVGFGHLANWLEGRLNRGGGPGLQMLRGSVAWLLAVLPWVALAWLLRDSHPYAHWVVDVLLLWFALGARSLCEHGEAVAAALAHGDLDAARTRVGWIVSRDTTALDAGEVARAGTESVLENGNDAVFGALFWFIVAGGAGVLLFRLANTLDAMWGYRNARFLFFGRAAARLDDALNWLPARLTALTYAVLGDTRRALRCWRSQAPQWDSPNAGPVMAAGAGSLAVCLGGAATYHGQREIRPQLGEGRSADAGSVRAAITLVRRGLLLWLAVLGVSALLGALAGGVLAHA